MDNPARIATCNVCLLTEFRACLSCEFNPARLELKPDELAQVARKELLTQSQIKSLENHKECAS